MHALKDRISEKLSRLFSDSPAHVVDQHLQARPYSNEGKSLSSAFPFILPSVSFDSSTSNTYTDDIKPIQSLSYNWRSKTFSWQDKPLDGHAELDHENDNKAAGSHHEEYGLVRDSGYERKESLHSHLENGERDSAESNASGSKIFEDASEGQSFEKYMSNLTEDSLFIYPELYEFFDSSLPNLVKGCQWVLLYSTAKHGISLRTLIRKSAELAGPCLLIAGDKQGAIFGGLLECPLKPTVKRKYQGTNQTFVFTTLYGEPMLFRPTGANRYFYLCLNDSLALGGGGNFALSLDGDLLSGTSGPCETFGNSCLAHNEEFELKNVELWGFMHASKYLS